MDQTQFAWWREGFCINSSCSITPDVTSLLWRKLEGIKFVPKQGRNTGASIEGGEGVNHDVIVANSWIEQMEQTASPKQPKRTIYIWKLASARQVWYILEYLIGRLLRGRCQQNLDVILGAPVEIVTLVDKKPCLTRQASHQSLSSPICYQH